MAANSIHGRLFFLWANFGCMHCRLFQVFRFDAPPAECARVQVFDFSLTVKTDCLIFTSRRLVCTLCACTLLVFSFSGDFGYRRAILLPVLYASSATTTGGQTILLPLLQDGRKDRRLSAKVRHLLGCRSCGC